MSSITLDDAYTRACEVHGPCDYESFKAAFCPDHWCNKHAAGTGEGDICGQCEAEADQLAARITFCISCAGGLLRVTTIGGYAFKVPVYSFNDAKRIFMTLDFNSVMSCALHYTDGLLDKAHKFK